MSRLAQQTACANGLPCTVHAACCFDHSSLLIVTRCDAVSAARAGTVACTRSAGRLALWRRLRACPCCMLRCCSQHSDRLNPPPSTRVVGRLTDRRCSRPTTAHTPLRSRTSAAATTNAAHTGPDGAGGAVPGQLLLPRGLAGPVRRAVRPRLQRRGARLPAGLLLRGGRGGAAGVPRRHVRARRRHRLPQRVHRVPGRESWPLLMCGRRSSGRRCLRIRGL
jgi:hypothetical protein